MARAAARSVARAAPARAARTLSTSIHAPPTPHHTLSGLGHDTHGWLVIR